MNFHINVEVVSSMKSVKYIYKYMCKGHDAAAVIIQENSEDSVLEHDEIKQFVESLCVGPVEACWRILSEKLQEKSHVVFHLPVHLPNEQTITILKHSKRSTCF